MPTRRWRGGCRRALTRRRARARAPVLAALVALGCTPAPRADGPARANTTRDALAPDALAPDATARAAPLTQPAKSDPEGPRPTAEDCADCEDCAGHASFRDADGTVNSCCRWVGPVDCPGHHGEANEPYCVMAEACPPACCGP